jgi:hemoglobin-like flavoprotein
MVGGKTSQILDQAIVALKDSKDENKELREMIRTMAESHKALVIRSQAMEEKIEGLILSQQQVSDTSPTYR